MSPEQAGLLAALLAVGGAGLLALTRRLVRPRTAPSPLSLLLLVKNQQQLVEGLVRQLCHLAAGAQGGPWDLVVVDEGSEDETRMILERLDRQFSLLKTAIWRGPGAIGSTPLDLGYFLCDRALVLVARPRDEAQVERLLDVLRRWSREGAPGHAAQQGPVVGTP